MTQSTFTFVIFIFVVDLLNKEYYTLFVSKIINFDAVNLVRVVRKNSDFKRILKVSFEAQCTKNHD